MPAAKRRRPAKEPESVPSFTRVEPGLAFISDRHAADLGIDGSDSSQRIQDAMFAYEWVHANLWTSHNELIAQAVQVWGEAAVDKLNEALALLEKLGRIYRLEA